MNAPDDDDTWLDALRGKPVSESDAAMMTALDAFQVDAFKGVSKSDVSIYVASTLRQAMLTLRDEQSRPDFKQEFEEIERLLLRLSKEGLLESDAIRNLELDKILQMDRQSKGTS